MKRTLIAMTMTLVFSIPALAQHHGHGGGKSTTVTLTGEVLDMTCFLSHPETGMGPDHAKCAKACLSKGLAPGFLASDGVVYLVIGSGHDSPNARVAEFAGRRSTITGIVHEQKGVKAIEIVSIVEAR